MWLGSCLTARVRGQYLKASRNISGLFTGAAGDRGTGWDRLARRRRENFGLPLSREWDPEVTFLCSRWDGYKRVICVRRGMGIATCAEWEREWELERELEREWELLRARNGNGNGNGNGSKLP